MRVTCSNPDWLPESDNDWIHTEKSGDKGLSVTVDDNNERPKREGLVRIIVGNQTCATLTVVQLGWEKEVLLSRTLVETPAENNTISITVTANFDYHISIGADWIQLPDNNSRAQTMKKDEVAFIIKNNFSTSPRTAEITFFDPDDDSVKTKTLTVVQHGAETENFDYTPFFTDASCSELRAGISRQDIESCEHPFYHDLALRLLEGNYSLEFRSDRYKAFEHPQRQGDRFGTLQYSLTDNPTGMAVEAGKEVAVLADLKGRSDVQFCIIGFDMENEPPSPTNDGFMYRRYTYKLTQGLNRITPEYGGLTYIFYHADDYKSAPEVRIHIADGATVNGYYDSQKHGPDGWKQLLDKATDKHFDVMGRFAHLIYRTDSFRNNTSNLYDLITVYDEMVYRDQVFFGLMRHRDTYTDDMHHNRLQFSISYDNRGAVASTFNNHVRVPRGTATGTATRVQSLPEHALAHEIGHVHQIISFMSGGLYGGGDAWPGMLEMSNDIMSNYITAIRGIPNVTGGYDTAWNTVLTSENKNYQDIVGGYSNPGMVPLWQLELYFGKVLGDTPKLGDYLTDIAADPSSLSDAEYKERYDGFYPRLYESIRDFAKNHKGEATRLQYQAQFVRLACEAAQMNLLDFFDRKWKFLAVRDNLTQEYADNIRNQIKAKNWPEPKVAMEYITDFNKEIFRQQKRIVKGTTTYYEVTKQADIRGWKYVLAYEVREDGPDGRLVKLVTPFYKDGIESGYDDNASVSLGGISNPKVYAVQYDGERIEIEIQ